MAHAQSRGYIFQTKWSYIFHNFGSLHAGYHHIPLDKSSIPKTAFNSPFGKYEYIKVPFGLAQALAYFQELMTGILKDFPFARLPIWMTLSYLVKHHRNTFHTFCMVFEKLRTANLSMKKSKCNFFSKEIQYLGHILSALLAYDHYLLRHMQSNT